MKKKTIFLTIILLAATIFVAFRFDEVSGRINPEIDAMAFPKKLAEEGCMGLNYHRIRDESTVNQSLKFLTRSDELNKFSVYTKEFEQQVTALQEAGANFVTLEELISYQEKDEFPEKCVWISFDDGDKSVYENAFPILKEKQIPFTMYLIVGQVGNENFMNFELADWEEIGEMMDSGLMSVGSHTYDMHYWAEDRPIFKHEDQEAAYLADLIKSREVIKEKLGVTPVTYAIPFGSSNDKLIAVAEKAGFHHQAILAPQVIRPGDGMLLVNRIVVNQPVFEETLLPWVKGS